jgi:hypothetical protein
LKHQQSFEILQQHCSLLYQINHLINGATDIGTRTSDPRPGVLLSLLLGACLPTVTQLLSCRLNKSEKNLCLKNVLKECLRRFFSFQSNLINTSQANAEFNHPTITQLVTTFTQIPELHNFFQSGNILSLSLSLLPPLPPSLSGLAT